MTKELSKQICDKCGIEYEKQIFTGWVSYSSKDDKQISESESIILDFGQPENFMKLIELKFKENGIECTVLRYLTTDIQYGFENREHILDSLIFCMTEAIKQSIREAEWKYE